MAKELIMENNPIHIKSYSFAIRIVKLYKYLLNEQKEFVLSKQILESGTAIGALVKESEHAQSKADFINKMSIALKEANETVYWLELLKDSKYLKEDHIISMNKELTNLLKMLISIVKTSKQNK